MKKYLLLFGVIISFAIQAYPSQTDVYMTIFIKGHVEKNTAVHRSPMLLPVNVFYDSDAHQIEVTGDDEVVAQIFLCDENGNVLDYSPSINAVLQIPSNYSGVIIIRIENEDWSATGEIAV